MEEVVCVLHIGDGAREGKRSRIFTEHTLTKIKQCMLWRKKMKTSKYKTVIDNFPQSLEGHHGYHQNCYRYFTAIKETPELEESSSSTLPPTQHTLSPDLPVKRKYLRSCTSTILTKGGTGVLSKKCIFCKKETKVLNHQKESLVPVSYTHLDVYKRQMSSMGKLGSVDPGASPDEHFKRICRFSGRFWSI